MFSFLGHQIRFTDAVHDRHLMCQGGVLWMGRHELMRNVVASAARGDIDGQRVLARCAQLMHDSAVLGRSIVESVKL